MPAPRILPRTFLSAFLFQILGFVAHAQGASDTAGKVAWGFPITSYTVPLSDTALVVQVELPEGNKSILSKQIGVLRGVARGSDVDTGDKGWGRCHLIKGAYHYFAIHTKGTAPKEGDLVYTLIQRPAGIASSPLARCASHGVTFLDVEDSAFYKPSDFLAPRTRVQNDAMMQKMVSDVQRTGAYFLEENPEMNAEVSEGPYAGRKVLDVMIAATEKDLADFMGYVHARPRRYAGNRWKISETFATWVVAGAPKVVE